MSYSRSRATLLSILAASLICPARVLPAPAPPQADRNQQAAPGCDPTGALSIVEQQLSEVKTLDDVPARIKVLIRAAELLWATRPETARGAFTEAYDLAAKDFKEHGDAGAPPSGSTPAMFLPDQRFIVINAVGRRDAEWAKRLAERAARESEERADEVPASGDPRLGDFRMGEKFMDAAWRLAPVNRQAAVDFARKSFRYPASWNGITNFLYRLAEVDQKTGDQFYLEALEFYSARPVNELLYLSGYPFGLNRFVGPDATSAYSPPPQGFVPSPQLQQRLIEVLLRRAQAAMQAQPQPAAGSMDLPESAQLYLALDSLSPLVTQPALAERVAQVKVALGAALPAGLRQRMTSLAREQREIDEPSFTDLTRQAERETVSWRKDYALVHAVMAGLASESLDRLEGLTGKVGDENVRRQLLNWLYFRSAQKATAAGQLEDAARLARQVEEVDQRAYLFFEIAQAAEKKFGDRGRFREALDEAAKVALAAPNTEQRARALLGVAHLYSKLDQFRAVEVMGDAVKTINRLEHPNFMPTLFQQIKAEQFGVYVSYPLAGFDIETGFRDLAAADFQGALALARTLDNKALRAGVVMAIAARCLEKPAQKKAAGEKGGKAAPAPSPTPTP
jgi:hypothetical protein